MSRLNLIDKDALMDKISVFFERNEELINPSVMDCVEEIIEQAESVDAVEVVRCKNCRWGKETCGNIECFADINVPTEYHGYDWFCPIGERNDGEVIA